MAKPPKKNLGGRPPRAGKASAEFIGLRVTKAERAAWEREAGDRSLSEWLRSVANSAAKVTP